MAVNWQTGEPPCGQELLIEYRYRMTTKILHTVAAKSQPNGAYWRENRNSIESIQIEVLRWSTLDDDSSAKAMGALEKMLRDDRWGWICLEQSNTEGTFNADLYFDSGQTTHAEAPSLIEAIEKLTADQQTKGASDAQA